VTDSSGVAKPSSTSPGDAAGAHEGEVFDPRQHRPQGKAVVRLAVLAVIALGVLLAVGIVPRLLRRSTALADEQRAATDTPRVRVAKAQRITGSAGLVLPGSVQPLQETVLYARANGYVRKWLVDIGAQVKKGQVLAELDLPDVDEELRQAEAARAQAQAGIAQAKTQLELARTTNHRYTSLGPSGVVSQQEVDQ
jgi:membrane fusion protein (multidrug efflux system)